MPAYGEKQQPAGKKKIIIERPLVSRKGIVSTPPYKGNAVHNANR
jgi:hypothetical protein|tara:strand:- start:306 stop:440 length:135 start_codon:yes stop_codon:yes gene_type:complete